MIGDGYMIIIRQRWVTETFDKRIIKVQPRYSTISVECLSRSSSERDEFHGVIDGFLPPHIIGQRWVTETFDGKVMEALR